MCWSLKMVAGFLALLVTAGIACGSLIVDPSELLIGDNKPHHVIFSCREVIEDNLHLVEENVTWMKDGERLAENLKYHIEGMKRQLNINMIEVADTGIYTCAVEDGPSHKNATASLYVKPEVSAKLKQTVVIGFDGTISCNVSTGVDYIQWKFNNEHLIRWKPINKEARDRGRYSAYKNGSLGISTIDTFDDGDYQCIGVNKAGKTSVNIRLKAKWPAASVPQPPGNCKRIKRDIEEEKSDTEHEEYLRNKRYVVDDKYRYLLRWQHYPVFVEAPPYCIKVWVKQELILPCRAVSYPHSTITWSKSTGVIREEDLSTGRITITREMLRIKSVQQNDQTTYTCKAKNRFGTREYKVRVKVYDLKEICGKPIKYQIDRVSSIATWPWQVLIEYNSSVWSNRESFCGGTIIGTKWILTAFHCVLKTYEMFRPTYELFHPSDFIVRAGVYNRTVDRERSQQILNVSQIHHPPTFSITSDLAILELKEPIFFTKTVRPLCLPGKHDTLPIPGTECVVSGWGQVQDKGSNSDVLQKVSVPLVSWDDCKLQYDYLPDDAICAVSTSDGSGDACLSDNGGPLACQNSDNGEWVLVGVVSRCSYGYYANVIHNRKWIENIVGVDGQVY